MTRRIVVGSLPAIFLSLTASAAAQLPAQPREGTAPAPPAANAAPTNPCPAVGVQAVPGQPVRDGQRINFVATINGGDPRVTPTIVWNTTAGSVTQGHGTRRIEVDTTGAGATPEREVRADLWVGGYPAECQTQAANAVKIIAPATKFGDFGAVDDETFKKNIDALAGFMSQSPDNLFVIAYSGRNSERGFTYNWLKRITAALNTAGVSPRRVSAIDGGYREDPLFDFWTVPQGAEPPQPTPTIKRSDIVLPKPTPRKRP